MFKVRCHHQGGYDVEAISTSAVECIKVLLGDLPPQLPPSKATPEATDVMHEVAIEQSRHWKSVKTNLKEPEGGKHFHRASFERTAHHARPIEIRKAAAQVPVARKIHDSALPLCSYIAESGHAASTELLKAHRAYHLFSDFELVNVELDNAQLQDLYQDQVFCSCVPPSRC